MHDVSFYQQASLNAEARQTLQGGSDNTFSLEGQVEGFASVCVAGDAWQLPEDSIKEGGSPLERTLSNLFALLATSTSHTHTHRHHEFR